MLPSTMDFNGPVVMGMTLRSYYATKAMEKLLNKHDYRFASEELGETAFRFADAMIKAEQGQSQNFQPANLGANRLTRQHVKELKAYMRAPLEKRPHAPAIHPTPPSWFNPGVDYFSIICDQLLEYMDSKIALDLNDSAFPPVC